MLGDTLLHLAPNYSEARAPGMVLGMHRQGAVICAFAAFSLLDEVYFTSEPT